MNKQEIEYDVNIWYCKEYFTSTFKVNARSEEEAKQKWIELLNWYDAIIFVDVNLSDDLITQQ
jgi:hypothetical protein